MNKMLTDLTLSKDPLWIKVSRKCSNMGTIK